MLLKRQRPKREELKLRRLPESRRSKLMLKRQPRLNVLLSWLVRKKSVWSARLSKLDWRPNVSGKKKRKRRLLLKPRDSKKKRE